MRKAALVLALGGALAGAAPAGAGKDDRFPLEGRALAVTLDPGERARERGAKKVEETLRFEDGTVTFTAFAAHGFATAPVVADRKGKRWEVRIEAAGESGGRLSWQGEVRSGWFEGVAVWRPVGGDELNYSFSVRIPK